MVVNCQPISKIHKHKCFINLVGKSMEATQASINCLLNGNCVNGILGRTSGEPSCFLH